MRSHLTTLLAAAAVVAMTGTVFAQAQQPAPANPAADAGRPMDGMKPMQQAPADPSWAADQPMGGMMHGRGMMGQEDDGMMPMMKMMTQMSEMMESCNKMMQAKAQEQGAAPQKQGG